MRDFHKIKAFHHADNLVIRVYKITQGFPKEELYGLVSQIRRAAVSIAANIVEGSSRQHQKDYLQFLYVARGSAAEVGYLLSVALRLQLLSDENYKKIEILVQETARTLYGLINSVRKEIGERL